MLRERQKEERRQQILTAAEALVRERRSVDFPMLDLSERARLSPATPYNLFGSKLAILWALLYKCMERSPAEKGKVTASDPYLQVVELARTEAGVFAADPGLYRPLSGYLMRASDPVQRPAFTRGAIAYWSRAVNILPKSVFPGGIGPELFCQQFLFQIEGVIRSWADGHLNDEEFVAHVQFSAAFSLMAIAPDSARARLSKVIEGLSAVLSEEGRTEVSVQRA